MAGERAVVVPGDHAAALAVVTSWHQQVDGRTAVTTADHLVLVGMIAAAIADGRHRDVPGERVLASRTLDVSADRWRDDPDGHTSARAFLRKSWAQELEERSLRALAWPPVVVTFLRFRMGYGLDCELAECESVDQADQVRLTITGLAVAE